MEHIFHLRHSSLTSSMFFSDSVGFILLSFLVTSNYDMKQLFVLLDKKCALKNVV